MKKLYIILPLICLSLCSCEKWFDLSPKSELKADDLFEQEQGFRDALIGVYALMSQSGLYGGQLTMTYLDVLGQYYSSASTTSNSFQYAYNYDYTNTNEENRLNKIWKDMYNVIANINSILDRIDAQKDVFAKNNYELIKGEALGLRGLVYLDLVRMFGHSPAEVDGMNQPAIPYVDHFTNELYPCLSTSEVIALLLDDLKSAYQLLAEVDPYGPHSSSYDLDNLQELLKGREFRMNYYAVVAALARANLYKGNTTEAYQYASEVIQSQLFPLISGVDITGADKNGFVQENIFALSYPGVKDEMVDKYLYTSNSSPYFLAVNSSTLNKIFASTVSADYRRLWWLEESGSFSLLSKYNYSKRVPMLKISEMYLIASETAPSVEQSAEYLNQLLYHRGLPETDVNADNLSKLLKAEYIKEFMGEGQLFYYYKRLNIPKTPINERSISSPEAVYVFPLPKENTNFKEN